jgi:hypothetical protein
VLLVFAYGLPWGSADVPLLPGANGSAREVQFTGRDLYSGAAMSGWIALAGVAGLVATRSWGRIIIGGLCSLAGVGGAVAAIAFAVAPEGQLDAATDSLTDGTVAVSASTTLAWLVAAGAGAVVASTGAWACVRGRHWPRLGSRYERTPKAPTKASAWDAQNMGHDPTDDLVE